MAIGYTKQGEQMSLEEFFFAHDSMIELTSLGVQFPVMDVYEKTSFDEHFPGEE
jgi:hypothetical protein